VGDNVTIDLLRDGQRQHLTANIVDRNSVSSKRAADIHPGLAGAELADFPQGGVLVRSVAANTAAARNGLRANDVILTAGRVRIANLEQLRDTVRGASGFEARIQRGSMLMIAMIQ
jgi:serine protease Do